MADDFYIGLMSGTSLDGADAALVHFSDQQTKVVAFASAPMPPGLRQTLLALNQSGPDELHCAALAANALTHLYAQQVQRLLAQSGLDAHAVRAIGAHGQTVRHRPGAFDGVGYTLQLQNPALLAELCAIDVVADFRTRDLAAGGQGAPLVPPFHQAMFARPDQTRAVLNLGGMANLTLLQPDQPLLGFDTGPGNVLLDAWCQRHTGQALDADGAWAASGQVLPPLLTKLLEDPYFALPGPKSTGRDTFDLPWLQARLTGCLAPPVDVQATLLELTVCTCAQALRQQAPQCVELIVCGGGALNTHLMVRLQAALAPDCTVVSSQTRGFPPTQVEAAAFAWLARAHVQRLPASVPAVTGARAARVLGALYPR